MLEDDHNPAHKLKMTTESQEDYFVGDELDGLFHLLGDGFLDSDSDFNEY